MDLSPAPGGTARSRTSSGIAAALALGVIEGLIILTVTLSFAALVYSGDVATHLVTASGLFLLGATALNLVTAAATTLKGSVSVPQDATTTVVAVSVAAFIPGVAVGERLGTVFIYCLLATGITGLFMLGLGTFRLGKLVRFIPYPVIGGFLGGTGVLLVMGATELVTGSYSWTGPSVAGLTGALLLALVLNLLLRRQRSAMVFPGAVVAGFGLFYLILLVTGTGLDEARAMGLLPSAATGGLDISVTALTAVDWDAIGSGLSGLVTVPIVATLALLLNVTGLELVSDTDADLNRELRALGGANLAAAFTGSTAGYQSLGISAIAYKADVFSRWVTVVCGLVCLVGAFAGGTLVSLLPIPLIGGLLLMVGIGFIIAWVVDGRRQMTGPEYLLMLGLVAAVVFLGFLPAVLLGMTAAVALFTVAYSRLDPVRHVSNGAERSSSHDRSPEERAVIAAHAHGLVVIELQGYLFFGTARSLVDRVQSLVETTPALTTLIIDLRRVEGVDSTGLASFIRLHRLAQRTAFRLVLSEPPQNLAKAMERPDEAPVIAPDLDRAMEMAEEWLLAGKDIVADVSCLAEVFGEELWSRMSPNLSRVELDSGEQLADLGEGSVGLFLVDRGRISAEILVEEGKWQRVVSSGPGTILGEVSLYLASGRTARLVAEESSCVFTLDEAAIRAIESDDPAAGVELHRRLASVLAGRLATSNQMLRALLR